MSSFDKGASSPNIIPLAKDLLQSHASKMDEKVKFYVEPRGFSGDVYVYVVSRDIYDPWQTYGKARGFERRKKLRSTMRASISSDELEAWFLESVNEANATVALWRQQIAERDQRYKNRRAKTDENAAILEEATGSRGQQWGPSVGVAGIRPVENGFEVLMPTRMECVFRDVKTALAFEAEITELASRMIAKSKEDQDG